MSPAGRMGKQDPYPMWAPNKPLFRVQALGGVCGVGGGIHLLHPLLPWLLFLWKL